MSHFEEQRSFAPGRGLKPVKLDPIPENPTIEDAIKASHQVHDCVEAHRIDDRRDHKSINRRMTRVERQVAGIAKVVGVDHKGDQVRKTPMLMSRMAFFSTLSGAVFGLFLVVQIGNAVWPALDLAGHELWRFILQSPVAGAPPSK